MAGSGQPEGDTDGTRTRTAIVVFSIGLGSDLGSKQEATRNMSALPVALRPDTRAHGNHPPPAFGRQCAMLISPPGLRRTRRSWERDQNQDRAQPIRSRRDRAASDSPITPMNKPHPIFPWTAPAALECVAALLLSTLLISQYAPLTNIYHATIALLSQRPDPIPLTSRPDNQPLRGPCVHGSSGTGAGHGAPNRRDPTVLR